MVLLTREALLLLSAVLNLNDEINYVLDYPTVNPPLTCEEELPS